MQYLAVIAVLAATLTGTEALAVRGKKSECAGKYFNDFMSWPDEFGSGWDGSIATLQQSCTDVKDKVFTSSEEYWHCVPYNDLNFKIMIAKVGEVSTEQDGKVDETWCKGIMEEIVNDCEKGGSQEEANWKFAAHASNTECGA